METELLLEIAASNRWLALLPEILLGVFAVAILFIDLMVPRLRPYLSALTIAALAAVGAVLLATFPALQARETPEVLFGGLLIQESPSQWLRLFFIACAIVVAHLAGVYLQRQKVAQVEFYHLILIITGAFMVLVQSHHFILLFVALETVTIGFYIMVAYNRNSRASLESGLKYLIMGSMSSGILLFGVALLYAAASNPGLPATATNPLNFAQLASFIGAHDDLYNNSGSYLVLFGTVLVLVGVGFKIGVVPFQFWVPDVYQGAPTPVTALLAIVSKAAGFYVLVILLRGPFADLAFLTVPLLSLIAIMTLIFGNLAALGQRNVKRVMGQSGVAHAGILLMGVLASFHVDWAIGAVLFYLVTYAIASFGVFEVMAHVADATDDDQELDHYDDLLKKDAFLGGTLLVSLGSLAGIPPLAGFVAKLLIFIAAFQAGLYTIFAIALAGVVLSIFYYFGWMRAAVMRNPFLEEEPERQLLSPSLSARLVMGTLIAGSIVLGLYQGFFVLG